MRRSDQLLGPSSAVPAPPGDGPFNLAARFWPFAEMTVCVLCGNELPTREAVAVVNAGNWAGFAHEDCGDDE